MTRQSRLVALRGPVQGCVFEIVEDMFSIGRDPSNSLCLPDSRVSRRHCVIEREGARFTIRDLESVNGTSMNGVRVVESALEPGDKLGVGGSEFVFLTEEATADSGSADDIVSASAMSLLHQDDATVLQPWLSVDAALRPGRTAQNLKSMLRVAAAIGAARDVRALEHELMEALGQAIPAQRGAILPTEESVAAHYWSRDGDAEPFHAPRSIVKRVLADGAIICLNDVLISGADATAESIALSRINSVMAAPLVSGDERLGVIYLDTRDSTVRFEEDHLQLLGGIARVAAAPLANALRLARLESDNRRLQAELSAEHHMVGDSSRMREVYRFIRKTAPTTSTVLIDGESGTGKELVARAIHRGGPRARKPFVAINCAAITETLLESEFFGHEKGAFTGAVGQKKGKLEEADGGAVFLNEIGELAPPLQAKLLRVLQEREFERVGGTRPIKVDVRIIAATNRSLEEMIRRSTFRQDLYYRLNVVTVTVPPLRERREDILLLANHFLQQHRASVPRRILGFSGDARRCLTDYDWPGNVRELQNAIERAVVLGTTEEIRPEDLPDSIVESAGNGPAGQGGTFHETVRELKRQLVAKAFERANRNHAEAARLLGIHPNNLYRLMKNLDLKASTKDAEPRDD